MYGNACDVTRLANLAEKHALRVLYDAAHVFGSTLDGKSLFAWGDAAVGSFHATKLFHTVEGGCVIMPDEEDKRRLDLLRAFGHVGDEHKCLGINAKISNLSGESQAKLQNSMKKIVNDSNGGMICIII